MSELPKRKIYDLEERTYEFAKKVHLSCKNVQKMPENIDILRQVLRSSGSIGANYIEANESLGKKDFAMKIRICLREAKETAYWLRLLIDLRVVDAKDFDLLFLEALALKKIFSTILMRTGN